ncbi:MAG: ParB/Srx family N-terminal domain-containing protein [Crocosphaera sp.]
MRKLIYLSFALVPLLIGFHLPAVAKVDNCSTDFSNFAVGTQCQVSINKLHPTQSNVGMYQIEYNKALLEVIDEGKSDEYSSIKDYLKDKEIPVVVGPGGNLYLTDRHHTLRGIWEYYEGNPNIKVDIKVIENWQNKTNFWEAMKQNNYTYLGAAGREINPDELPSSIGQLGNDPYRSAIGMGQKMGFLKKPKDKQGNDIFFYQFKWADCLKQFGLKLDEDIDQFEVYQTLALMNNPEILEQWNDMCTVPKPKVKSLKSIVKILEN